MNGSEKQIKWAEKIKENASKHIVNILKFINESNEIDDSMRDVALSAISKAMNDSEFWIDSRDSYGCHSSDYDISEDEINGLKVASGKCSRFVEQHLVKYI